jgi:hypothetical protein
VAKYSIGTKKTIYWYKYIWLLLRTAK